VRGRVRVRARRNGRRLTASASTHAEHGTLDENAIDGTAMGNDGLTKLAERAGARTTTGTHYKWRRGSGGRRFSDQTVVRRVLDAARR